MGTLAEPPYSFNARPSGEESTSQGPSTGPEHLGHTGWHPLRCTRLEALHLEVRMPFFGECGDLTPRAPCDDGAALDRESCMSAFLPCEG